MTPEEYLRTRFLERIAHEARGAASISMGALSELESALAGREELRPLLGIAQRGLHRLLRMSESLGDAAELERGGAILAATPVALGELAVAASERARALEQRRGIALDLHCEPMVASVDAGRLDRAIFELASNAIRAARERVTVEAFATGDAFTVAVSDDGAGCGQPEPRFTPSSERRGLGLGLALAADVAALHGGQLVVGRTGDRTTIKILLPRPGGVPSRVTAD